jgi:hypothetical protein
LIQIAQLLAIVGVGRQARFHAAALFRRQLPVEVSHKLLVHRRIDF